MKLAFNTWAYSSFPAWLPSYPIDYVIEHLAAIGYEYMELGDYKKAFQIFSLVIRLNGNDPDSLNGIGMSLCELGRLKTSRAILEKTAELYPDDAITLANIAGIYWEEGDIGNSIHHYCKSLAIDESILETHFNLINLYYDQGDLFMAYIACLDLLKIYPDNIKSKKTVILRTKYIEYHLLSPIMTSFS